MNVLLLGSGGREHAYAKYLTNSPSLTHLFIAPGNAGTAKLGTNVPLNPLDFEAVLTFCKENKVSLIIPGNEDPLVHGIVDFMQQHAPHIPVAGPNKWCAQLEGSKSFSKKFMAKYHIPTAKYLEVTKENISDGIAFLSTLQAPYVLKADGLAAGKGVLIINQLAEAEEELKNMVLDAKFGEASAKVVIEEFLYGIELSVFVVSDGKNYKILGSAKDYKRIGEGDTGLNTGGMGAVSPVPFATAEFMEKVEETIVKPTINGLINEQNPFTGILFIGLMNNNGNPSVVEYNVRMGDPETEVIFPRLQTNMLDLMLAIVNKNLNNIQLSYNPNYAVCVFLVAKGYPQAYEKGMQIVETDLTEDEHIFHAGTTIKNNMLVTNGGRVIALTCLHALLPKAIENVNNLATKVNFEGKTFRTDIGRDLLAYTYE